MTKQNLTLPYPTSIKPVRDGVYAVSTPSSKGNKFAYYDELGWRRCGGSVREAYGEKDSPEFIMQSSMTIAGATWQGIKKGSK